ncbi:uncharacterized protein BDZ99DRAFT_138513 [Mytilinidion resinicola]|uniref:Uncharacterized protein n=1 Tax=Mytilinidion resinicola TaxID=574789 RepID=A0A6A6Z613_9PEZI|nr:uncharacterized protein BDZ99DRAFT_138513 [Mytilinidion resinicola]KAF2816541.1 hypothetical protein BDZ99DRAFT_138513 [Mytilinidion resinicola]
MTGTIAVNQIFNIDSTVENATPSPLPPSMPPPMKELGHGPDLHATATYLHGLITAFEKSEPVIPHFTTKVSRNYTEAKASSNDIPLKLTTQPTWSGLTLLPSRASTLPKRGGKARKRLVRACLLLNLALSTALGLAVGVAMRRAETGLTVGNTFLAFFIVI